MEAKHHGETVQLESLILMAYGPPRLTADAIERARRLVPEGTNLVVVPAVSAATRRLRTHATARVTVMERVGRAGLLAALDHGGNGAVLLVHDDVLVSAEALEAMMIEHAQRGQLTTAWTNDVGTPNSIGSLPPVRQALPAVAAAAVTAPRAVISETRSGCLLGYSRDIRALAKTRLTVARTRLRASQVPIVVAAGAVVAHDSVCVDQVAPPRSPDDRPLLCAALIVRNEADMLPDCLASLQGLVDRIVVCDTGSSDDTIAVARTAGAEVITRPWQDDFGWARNEVLQASADSWWILQVDADERVICPDPTETRRLLATDIHDSVGLEVCIENIDGEGRIAGTHAAPRLFRPDGVAYAGALHEMPEIDGRPIETASMSALSIRHLGYRRDVVQGRGKADRNIVIAQRQHDEQHSGATALQLARSLRLLDRDDPAIAPLMEQVLEDPDVGLPARAHALSCLADQHLRRGEHSQAMAMAADALELVPADDEAARIHAEAGLLAGRLEEVVDISARRGHLSSPAPLTTIHATRGRELLALMRAHAARDDLSAAAATAHELLLREPDLDPTEWHDVAAVLTLQDRHEGVQTLHRAAFADPSGGCIDALSRILPPEDAATIAVDVVTAGVVSPLGVRAGLVAAAVSDRADLAAPLAAHADVLDGSILDRLVEFAVARGAHGVAEELEAGAFFPL